MSGSETGLMTSREPFTVGLHKPQQQQQQPLLQNMRLAYPVATSSPTYHHHHPSTTVAAPTINNNGAGAGGVSGGEASAALPQVQGINVNMGGGGGSSSEPLKRKRGRPRKYGPDGTMALGLTPTSPTATVAVNQSGGAFSPAPPPTAPPSASALASPTSLKKARGRPPGSSSKKQQLGALGSAGFGFTPHVITVKAGEDLSSKIMSFSQNGPRAVCILSANGAISNVTLRQPATSGGTVTYEGRFEILSLSGSFLLSENGGQRGRTGGLSVSLSGPDGRVLGGGVAGLLIAASPVQVVVGSFVADGRKESKSANQMENLSAPPKVSSAGQSSSPSRGTLSESSGGPGSPLNQSTGACNNNNPQGIPGMPWK